MNTQIYFFGIFCLIGCGISYGYLKKQKRKKLLVSEMKIWQESMQSSQKYHSKVCDFLDHFSNPSQRRQSLNNTKKDMAIHIRLFRDSLNKIESETLNFMHPEIKTLTTLTLGNYRDFLQYLEDSLLKENKMSAADEQNFKNINYRIQKSIEMFKKLKSEALVIEYGKERADFEGSDK